MAENIDLCPFFERHGGIFHCRKLVKDLADSSGVPIRDFDCPEAENTTPNCKNLPKTLLTLYQSEA